MSPTDFFADDAEPIAEAVATLLETGSVIVEADLRTADSFYVEDNGQGIPPDEREAVFESGYSTADDGTGFGLSIVSEIVEAHGWALRLTDGERGGARFEITGVNVVE